MAISSFNQNFTKIVEQYLSGWKINFPQIIQT